MPSPRARSAQYFVLAVPLVIAAVMGWRDRWITDDGFIYLRVIRQVTAGNGPVFNTGERVEAFTSPLWVGLVALADVVAPIRSGVARGRTRYRLARCSASAPRWRARGCSVRVDAPQAFLLPFGALAFVVLFPVWVFETSGLETGMTFVWKVWHCSSLAQLGVRRAVDSRSRACACHRAWTGWCAPSFVARSVLSSSRVVLAGGVAAGPLGGPRFAASRPRSPCRRSTRSSGWATTEVSS